MKNRFKLKGCFIFALILTLIMSTMPVMAFAEATDQWVEKAPMSTARTKFQTVVVNSKIYVMGGDGLLTTVEEYDPSTDKWTSKASMTAPRRDFETEVVGGKIYIIGGDRPGGFLSTVEEYDPFTDKWTSKASMSTARTNFQTATVDGKIYALGGFNGNSVIPTVEEYDPSTNKWTSKASMSIQRNWFQTEVINGKIYAIGGDIGRAMDYTYSLDEYDPAKNTWTTKAPMTNTRIASKTQVINGKLYLFDGYYYGSPSKHISSIDEFDPVLNSWQQKAMSTVNAISYSEVINEKIYVIGNYNNLPTLEEYNPVTNKWTLKASMLTSKSIFNTAAINGTIYAIGGVDSENTYLSSVEAYTPTQTDLTLTAVAGDKQVSLSWSPVAGTTGYNIYRSTTSGSSYTKIASDVTSTTYTDTGLTNGVTYYYYVTAIDSSGTESQPSNEASATPTAPSSGGYNATLKITMVTGEIKEYNVNSTVVESFIAWFNSKGSESPVFTFEKTSDLGPYTSHTDYLAYDKISSFIVLKY